MMIIMMTAVDMLVLRQEVEEGDNNQEAGIFLSTEITILQVRASDMENVRNFTRAGFFNSRFYPKVCELRQFQNRDKTA